MTHPCNLEQKRTYSNSLLKLQMKSKYAIELSPVKLSCGKDTKRYRKSFPKASTCVLTLAYPI